MKNLLQLERDFEQDFNEIAKKSYLMFYASDAAEEFLDFEEEEKDSDNVILNENENSELENMECNEKVNDDDSYNLLDVEIKKKRKEIIMI